MKQTFDVQLTTDHLDWKTDLSFLDSSLARTNSQEIVAIFLNGIFRLMDLCTYGDTIVEGPRQGPLFVKGG